MLAQRDMTVGHGDGEVWTTDCVVPISRLPDLIEEAKAELIRQDYWLRLLPMLEMEISIILSSTIKLLLARRRRQRKLCISW